MQLWKYNLQSYLKYQFNLLVEKWTYVLLIHIKIYNFSLEKKENVDLPLKIVSTRTRHARIDNPKTNNPESIKVKPTLMKNVSFNRARCRTLLSTTICEHTFFFIIIILLFLWSLPASAFSKSRLHHWIIINKLQSNYQHTIWNNGITNSDTPIPPYITFIHLSDDLPCLISSVRPNKSGHMITMQWW